VHGWSVTVAVKLFGCYDLELPEVAAFLVSGNVSLTCSAVLDLFVMQSFFLERSASKKGLRRVLNDQVKWLHDTNDIKIRLHKDEIF
jgi:hypothetical protein